MGRKRPARGPVAEADALMRRGCTLYTQGRRREALDALTRSVEISPDTSSLAHFVRAKVLLELDRAEESLAAYDKSLELDPRDALAHCNRGGVLARLGRHADALDAYDRAIRVGPVTPEFHSGRAGALDALGRSEEADEARRRAEDLGARGA